MAEWLLFIASTKKRWLGADASRWRGEEPPCDGDAPIVEARDKRDFLPELFASGSGTIMVPGARRLLILPA